MQDQKVLSLFTESSPKAAELINDKTWTRTANQSL